MEDGIKEFIENELSISPFFEITNFFNEDLNREITYRLVNEKERKLIRERKYDVKGRLIFVKSFERDKDGYIEFLEKTHTYSYLDDNIIVETIKSENEIEVWITRKFNAVGQLLYESKIINGDESPFPYHFEYDNDRLISIEQKWNNGDIYYRESKLILNEKNTIAERKIIFNWDLNKLQTVKETYSNGKGKRETKFIYNDNSKLSDIESRNNLGEKLFKTSTSYEYMDSGKTKKSITFESIDLIRKDIDIREFKKSKLSIHFKISSDSPYEINCYLEEREIENKIRRSNEFGTTQEKVVKILTSKELVRK